jgi:hypothetical protein
MEHFNTWEDLREIDNESLNWIEIPHDRSSVGLVHPYLCVKAGNFLTT